MEDKTSSSSNDSEMEVYDQPENQAPAGDVPVEERSPSQNRHPSTDRSSTEQTCDVELGAMDASEGSIGDSVLESSYPARRPFAPAPAAAPAPPPAAASFPAIAPAAAPAPGPAPSAAVTATQGMSLCLKILLCFKSLTLSMKRLILYPKQCIDTIILNHCITIN